MKKVYRNGSLDAIKETDLDFPLDCPYTITEILERIIELD